MHLTFSKQAIYFAFSSVFFVFAILENLSIHPVFLMIAGMHFTLNFLFVNSTPPPPTI